ncbi:hypothetical protein L6164_017380 [Bauhinia variegata]|uniref:Uncharacterized protein n=1 Tax=Bauhinia variegata TaxID=167791 RepID=A0ACB9N8H1_BAUVA|nr:hypothetical protein L6164_017380 [Bauhinia variegata]
MEDRITGASAPILFSHPNRLESSPFLFIEDAFLSNLKTLRPEQCIAAAYGNILPNEFLNVPPWGTVNTHLSYLSLHRGTVPVQRAFIGNFFSLDDVKETGVSLGFTIHEQDAGSIIASEVFQVDDQIKAPNAWKFFVEVDSFIIQPFQRQISFQGCKGSQGSVGLNYVILKQKWK